MIYGFVGPKNTPKEVVEAWNSAARKVIENDKPFLLERYDKMGAEIRYMSPEEFGAELRKQRDFFAKIVKEVIPVKAFTLAGRRSFRSSGGAGDRHAKDEGSSLLWLGVAVIICIGSLRLSLGSFNNPGPGFFPFVAGLVLGVLAAVVYVQARRAASSTKENKKPVLISPGGVKKIVLTTVALLAYVVGMEYLGFLISTFIFFAFLLRSIEPQRWSVVILESLLASGVCYFIFQIWLRVELPRGIFQI